MRKVFGYPLNKNEKKNKDALGRNFEETEIKKIDISDLDVDLYQRDIKPSKVKKYVKYFNSRLVGIILVSYRNGKYYVIDGQHRVEVLRELGIKSIRCEVLKGLTYEEEADLFKELNSARIKPNANELFNSEVEKKDKDALAIVDILNKYNFTYPKKGIPKTDNTINCMATLQKIQKDNSTAGLERVMRIIKLSWFGDKTSLNVSIIRGIATFLKNYSKIKDEFLIKSLEKQNPRLIVEQAILYSKNTLLKAYRADGTCYHVSKVIRDLYNEFVPEGERVA